MSIDKRWDIESYREDHESEEHWELRRAFLERWKDEYPEERLVCLARVFANIEFMGCRYPVSVMQEVARLSRGVAEAYRKSKKLKLQRTFVSASDAAEDRAKGVKRKGGVIIEPSSPKSSKINFVPQGYEDKNDNCVEQQDSDSDGATVSIDTNNQNQSSTIMTIDENSSNNEMKTSGVIDANQYFKEMLNVKCLDVRRFNERMFYTGFGRMVLLIRPWASKLWNIQASCQVCNITLTSSYHSGCFSLMLNGQLVARATGDTKQEAKSIVEMMAWNRLREEMVSVLMKEQWIAHGDARISVSDVSGKPPDDQFGTPIDNSVATKMMKLMGWKGGGLGVDSQGIAEPIKPKMQMVNRAGLGSSSTDIKQLRKAAIELMRRYMSSDTLDLDLVFSSEFSKEERAQLHQCAQKAGLASRSYGDKDRFLVVKKKLDPFSLVRAVIEKGGNTPKYQVFIPVRLATNGR